MICHTPLSSVSRSPAAQRSLSRIQAIVAGLFLCYAVSAEDWPQFRGPGGEGHSAETGLPLEWSESRHVIWKYRSREWAGRLPAIQAKSSVDDDGH